MKIETIESVSEFIQIKTLWDNLLSKKRLESIWQSYEWLSSWWSAYGGDASMIIPCLYSTSEILLAIPLMIQKTKIKGMNLNVLKFLESGITPRSEILCSENADQHLDLVWQSLEKQNKKWDVAVLSSIEEDGYTYRLLKKYLTEKNINYLIEEDKHSPYIDMSNGWDEYWNSIKRKTRKEANRQVRRLAEGDGFKIVEITDSSEIKKHLKTCFEISGMSWKGEQGLDMGGNNSRKQFFEQFTISAVENGWVSIWLLEYENKFIAFEYLLTCGSDCLVLAADFDLSYKQFSLATILRKGILEQLVARGIKSYDFSGNSHKYKLRWTKNVRKHLKFWIFNDRLKSKMLYQVKANILK